MKETRKGYNRNMSSKQLYVIVFVSALALIGGIFSLTDYASSINYLKVKPSATANQPVETKSTQVSYTCQAGKTAMDLLLASQKNVGYEGSEGSDLGVFVTEINDVKQGSGKYWLYSVNGQEATISASSYVCQANEEIKWELR